MLLQSLSIRGRRAVLASTVAFSWLLANPLLPAGFGDDNATVGAAFAKGGHGGHHKGANADHKGGHHKGKGSQNQSEDDDDDGDDEDDDDDQDDDDQGDDDDNDDQ